MFSLELLSMHLKGYTLLALSNINELQLDLTTQIQIIIGTNGCGKSSLLKEMSILPADHKLYEKGGFKKVCCRYNNRLYYLFTLISESGKVTHEFYIDNQPEEGGINENHTGKVTLQLDLIQQHFGLDNVLLPILTKPFSFTTLGPTQRKMLLSRLDKSNTHLAIRLYKEAEKELKDQQGFIRLQQERLNGLVSKLEQLTKESIMSPEQISEMHEDLNYLFQVRLGSQHDHSFYWNEIVPERTSIESEMVDLITMPMPRVTWENGLEGLTELISTLREKKASINSAIAEKQHQITELEHILHTLTQNQTTSAQDMEKELALLKEEQCELLELIGDEYLNHLSAYSRDALLEIVDAKKAFLERFLEMEDNSERKFGKQKLSELDAQMHKLSEQIYFTNNKVSQLQQELTHIEHSAEVTCPACNHKSKPFIARDASLVLEELKRYIEQLNQYQSAQEETQRIRQHCVVYLQKYVALMNLTQHYPILTLFYRLYVTPEKVQFKDPTIEQAFRVMERKIQQYLKLAEVTNQLTGTESIITNMLYLKEKYGYVDYEQVVNDKKEECAKLNEQIESIYEQIEQLEIDRDTFNEYYLKREEILTRLTKLTDLYEKWSNALYDDVLDGIVKDTQHELAQHTAHHKQLEAVRMQIETLQQGINDAENTISPIQDILCLLSPSNGLIAQQLISFINDLVTKVNVVLKEIYTYDIEVQPCCIDEKLELDYLFPVVVDNQSRPVNDISQCSEGQQEVINFAFNLVLKTYLGISHHPILFDELGRTQDPVHIKRLMMFLKQMTQTGQVGQLFIVSHFASGFGVFDHADLLVLSDLNVSVPEWANRHVLIRE